MKKFKFRLERVKDFREAVKDDKRRELVIATMRLREAEARLQFLEQAKLNNTFGEGSIINFSDLMLVGFYGDRLKEEVIHQRLLIIELEEKVEEARKAYIEAAKEYKTLETLKEKKLQEYMEYVQKEDLKFLDELAVQRGNRQIKNQERNQ